ncbi:1,4-dihydroxy-2-naphthoate polyprenyltransferase [Anaerolineales bacterium HSG25]|nr:1,4-dihydroxy-2-naphthoate polyprenyltransferase [Anaerolineales bacterium HSG25]
MTTNLSELSKPQIWILATRPKTLPAAAAPVVVGVAVAIGAGVFSFLPALAALLGALLIQVGTNLANDVFDYKKGADTSERLGPTRVTQAGLLQPNEVMFGMIVAFGLSALVGLYLVVVGGWPIILIGVLSIASGIAYTGGPFPLGYNGLGDLFVFVFFGPVAVGGTYYVQASQLSSTVLWASVPIGLLATAILVVNNLRDVDTDRKAGKRTLAVRLGAKGAQVEYIVLLIGAYLIPILMWGFGLTTIWAMLGWLSIPLAVKLIYMVLNEKGHPLNLALTGTAQLELLYAILFSIGLAIG